MVKMTPEKARAELAKRELAKDELRYMIRYTFPEYIFGEWHEKLFDALQRAESGSLKRLIVQMPPRAGKTEIISKRFPAWCIGRNPKRKIIGTSYGAELSSRNSRETRQIVQDELFRNVFPECKISEEKKEASNWETTERGGYYSVGVGGALTGMGFHIGIIDDYTKNREDAESPTIREKTWDWYTSTFYTRKQDENACIIVLACMVGDTKVLMANGSEKELRDIKIGDKVATYEKGRLTDSVIENHINHGRDKVLAITMKSGRIVRANERHPFLVSNGLKPEWIKTKNLHMGNKIVVLEDKKGSGKERSVLQKGVKKMQNVGGIALRTTTESGGQMDTGRSHQVVRHGERASLNIDMGLPKKSLKKWKGIRAESVLFVGNCQKKQLHLKAKKSYTLTIAMKLKRFVGCCVTGAISLLDMRRASRGLLRLQNTIDFTVDEIVSIVPDGEEDVFDVQVARTENFIANGAVSHNTRWHDDDLIGRLLKNKEGDEWEMISFPALNENDESFFPERFSSTYYQNEKKNIGVRDFAALYQQDPIVAMGALFKKEDFRYFAMSDIDATKNDFEVGIVCDPAFSTRKGSDDMVTIALARHRKSGEFYELERFADTTPPSVSKTIPVNMANKYKSAGWNVTFISVEDVSINRNQTIFVNSVQDTMNQVRLTVPLIRFKPRVKKEDRIRFKVEPVIASHKYYFRCDDAGNDAWTKGEEQFLRFPTADHDDIPDCIAQGIEAFENRTGGDEEILLMQQMRTVEYMA